MSSVALETEPESSRESWRISNPSNPTSDEGAVPGTRSIQNPKDLWRLWYTICHTTLLQEMSDGLVSRGFGVISVKQMTVTRRSPSDGSTTVNLTRS
jgi:hypothetical protein